tara:strand:+ start:2497 stop:2718 length:222 start_codon:yes stop_codon:yes gene_type:complete
MIEDKDIEILGHNEQFAKYLNQLCMIREDCIQEMRNVNTDRLQQISGQIIAIDDALDLGNWETIRIRWNEILQ